MAMMKNILVRLAVSVALSVGTPALADDGKVTAKLHATVAREVAAPSWSAACMTDHGPSTCGEPMWVYGGAAADAF
jgi:hypothetical protein